MRQTLQFLGLMACGLLLAGIMMLVIQAFSGHGAAGLGIGPKSAVGIDYVSFGVGLAMGLLLAEIARLSWSDMPRRMVAWMISNGQNVKYGSFACVALLVLIYV